MISEKVISLIDAINDTNSPIAVTVAIEEGTSRFGYDQDSDANAQSSGYSITLHDLHSLEDSTTYSLEESQAIERLEKILAVCEMFE